MRRPRAFFENLKIIKEYSEVDAELFCFLRFRLNDSSDYWAGYQCVLNIPTNLQSSGYMFNMTSYASYQAASKNKELKFDK